MNSDELFSFFNEEVFGGNNSDSKYSITDELDDLWDAYNDYILELKAEGYKIFRNSDGKHIVQKL